MKNSVIGTTPHYYLSLIAWYALIFSEALPSHQYMNPCYFIFRQLCSFLSVPNLGKTTPFGIYQKTDIQGCTACIKESGLLLKSLKQGNSVRQTFLPYLGQ